MAGNSIVKYTGWRHSGAIWHGVNPSVKKAITKLIEVDLTGDVLEKSMSEGIRSTIKDELSSFFDQRYNQPTMLLSNGLWDDGADTIILVLNRLNSNGYLTKAGKSIRHELSQLILTAYQNGRVPHVD